MKRIVLVAAVVFLICQFACAEEAGPNFQHLKFFEPYIGTWIRQGALEEDLFFGKKGDVGTSSITWEWGYNKNVVDWQWEFDFAGKRSGTKGTFSWDPKEKMVVGAGVFSDGGVIRVTGKSTDPLSVLAEFLASDGNATSQVETFTLSGIDTMTIKVTDRKGGSVTADSPDFTFTRDKPTEQEPGPNCQHLKPMEWMIGEWYFETTLEDDFLSLGTKGDKLTFHMTFEWGLNKNVLMARAKARVQGKQFLEHQSTIGWDAEKKQVVVFSFQESGGRGEGTITLENEGIVVQKVRLISPEGQLANVTVTIKRIDQDTLSLQRTDMTVGGVKQPDDEPSVHKRKR